MRCTPRSSRRSTGSADGAAPSHDTLLALPTLPWHGFPSDYYRFSPEAVREVLCADLAGVEIELVLRAPRAIGSGIKP